MSHLVVSHLTAATGELAFRGCEAYRRLEPWGHLAYRGRSAGHAAGCPRVLGDADAGEQQAVQRLAQQRRYQAVGEGHAGGTRAEGVGEQVQPALPPGRRELRFTVLPVIQGADVSRGKHDERCVTTEPLVEADVVELVAQLAGACRR